MLVLLEGVMAGAVVVVVAEEEVLLEKVLIVEGKLL